MENCLPTTGKLKVLQSLRPLLSIVLTVFSSFLFAQTTIDGKVASGDTALMGATIQVKGSGIATQSDGAGNFTLNVPSNATLVISSIGYSTQEVKVGNRFTLNIQLQAAAMQIEE